MDYVPFLVRKDLPEETENSHNFPHITPGPLVTLSSETANPVRPGDMVSH